MQNTSKSKYFFIIGGCVTAIILALVVALSLGPKKDVGKLHVDIVPYSCTMTKDLAPLPVLSYCYYSTQEDKDIIDTAVMYDSNSSKFRSYLKEHWDISQVLPAFDFQTEIEKAQENKLAAVFFASSELQFTDKLVMMSAAYETGENEYLFVLRSYEKPLSWTYDHDLNAECKQVCSMFFYDADVLQHAKSITIAIDDAAK